MRFDPDGRIVGLTLVRPKHLLETKGEVPVTLPTSSSLAAAELAAVLS